MCKVKKDENLFWGDSQFPLQNARAKVRLLYLIWAAYSNLIILELISYGWGHFQKEDFYDLSRKKREGGTDTAEQGYV